MGKSQGYRTQAFAEALAAAAGRLDDGRPPPWAATFESDRLFRTVRSLAGATGMGDAALYVVMDDGEGFGAAYSLGRADRTSAALTVGEGFPLRGPAPSGSAVVAYVEGRGTSPTVRLVRLKDGLRHGHEPDAPGYVEVTRGSAAGNYYAHGKDVTSLVLDPPRTAEGALALEGDRCPSLHPEVVAMMDGAMGRGEAVVVRGQTMPRVVLALLPPDGAYRLLGLDRLPSAMRGLGGRTPVLTVHVQEAGTSCAAVRTAGVAVGMCSAGDVSTAEGPPASVSPR